MSLLFCSRKNAEQFSRWGNENSTYFEEKNLEKIENSKQISARDMWNVSHFAHKFGQQF